MRRILGWLIGLAVIVYAAPALANGRADYIPRLDPALQRQIQLVLRREGFYRGPINGAFRESGIAVIRRFRNARGIGNERIVHEDGTVEDFTYYLTPKLIRALFRIEIGSGTEELTACQQLDLMRRLGVTPVHREWDRYVSPAGDSGEIPCPPEGETRPPAEGEAAEQEPDTV